MRRHHLVFDALPEVLECILNCSAVKDEDIFDGHFVSMGVHLHFQSSCVVLFPNVFVGTSVQQVVHFLVVKLYVLHSHADFALSFLLFPLLLDLREQLSDSSWDHTFLTDTCLESFVDWSLHVGQVKCRFPVDLGSYDVLGATPHVPVALHCERFSTAGLAVDKYRRVKPKQDLPDQKVRPRPSENAFLRRSFIKHLVESKALDVVVFVRYSVRQGAKVKSWSSTLTALWCYSPPVTCLW